MAGDLHRRRGRRRGRGDAELAQKLEEACPVDIFAAADGGIEIVEENLDECILCGCAWTPRRPARCAWSKLYDGTALER